MARAKQNASPAPAAVQSPHFSTFAGGRGWLYALIVLIILTVVFIAGAAAASFHRSYLNYGGWGEHGFRAERHMGMMGSYGAGVNSGQIRLMGVVTSVNGNDFTVAGHGSTTSVTTNSSTQYQGGNQVKQNDSVVIFGNLSNGTFTADQVVIN